MFKYDVAFQQAIDEGLFTPRQAAERGQRDAYAAILASILGVLRARARGNQGALRVTVAPAVLIQGPKGKVALGSEKQLPLLYSTRPATNGS